MIEHKCADCGGKLKNKKIKIDRWEKGNLYIFENISAKTCVVCGAYWFNGSDIEVMENMINKGRTIREIKVPVMSF